MVYKLYKNLVCFVNRACIHTCTCMSIRAMCIVTHASEVQAVHRACGHDARSNLLVTLTYTSSADVFAVTVSWAVSFGIRPEGMRKVIGSFEGPSCADI